MPGSSKAEDFPDRDFHTSIELSLRIDESGTTIAFHD